jgi:hypothetical protein
VKKNGRYILTLDESEHFDVIGLCSGLNDYRIAWLLNQKFFWKLEHCTTPLEIPTKKGGNSEVFDYYSFSDEEMGADLYVLKNKQNGRFLSSEYPQLDYLIVFKENQMAAIDAFVSDLRSMSQIIAAYKYKDSDFSVSAYLQFE